MPTVKEVLEQFSVLADEIQDVNSESKPVRMQIADQIRQLVVQIERQEQSEQATAEMLEDVEYPDGC